MKIFKKSEPKTELKKESYSPKPDFLTELKNTNFKDVGTWSDSVRLASFFAIGLSTTVVASLLMVNPIINKIDFVKQQREKLYEKYRTDKTKLVIAQQTEKQLKEIENNFIFQLSQLPTESEIPDLVEDISRAGQKSKLPLNDIYLSPEVRKEVFIEQPIKMTASGEFHSFGRFVSDVSGLSRIVNLENFTATVDRQKTTIYPVINYSITATTYRYEDAVKKMGKGKNKKAVNK